MLNIIKVPNYVEKNIFLDIKVEFINIHLKTSNLNVI